MGTLVASTGRTSARLRLALLNRIGRMGDMPVRLRSTTLADVIADALDAPRPWHLDHEAHGGFREVEACALEALVILATRNRRPRP